ncbi:MAG: acyl-CoA thioesterase [Nitrospinota bacterium]|nr:acyl-CoA thioesterase [Nitrospinota bacterium]
METEVKVYYEDTDCGGVVYYANYLRYFERGRTEHLESQGISLPEYQKRGVVFTVVNASIEYKSPAVYGDILSVATSIEKIRGASFVVKYGIKRKSDGKLLITGSTRMACVDSSMKPIMIPDEIREALERG